MPYDPVQYYQLLSESLFQGQPNETQTLILMDIIRNTQQVNLEYLTYDLQLTSNLPIHQAYRPRTRGNRVVIRPEPEPVFTPPPRITKPTYKEKNIKLYKKDAASQIECPICQDTHSKVDTTTSDSCKHTFGSQCINHWMDICWTRDRKRANCPSCRLDIYEVIKYSERARPVAKERPTKKKTETPIKKTKDPMDLTQKEEHHRIIMPHQILAPGVRIQPPQLWTPPQHRIIMPHQRINL